MTTSAATVATSRRPVLADLLPGDRVRDVASVIGAAVVTGLLAQVVFHIPGTPVPVTGQTFAVLATAGALGRTRAIAAMLVYVLAGVAGMPWFAGGTHGYAGALAGYLVGFVLAAAVVGGLARRGADRRLSTAVVAMFAGSVVIYAAGAVGLMVALRLDPTTAFQLGVRPFIVGDLLKLLAAGAMLPALWRAVGRSGRSR